MMVAMGFHEHMVEFVSKKPALKFRVGAMVYVGFSVPTIATILGAYYFQPCGTLRKGC